MSRVLNLGEFEALARAGMEPSAFGYYAGAAGDGVSLGWNRAAFARRQLRPRVLVDVSAVEVSATMLGRSAAMPVGLAPCALQRLAHPEGEIAAARAAAAAGVVYCLSTLSSISLEEVAEAGGRRWFQLYVNPDRGVSKDLLGRAVAAGYEAVVLTADLPVGGYREGELRSGFSYPPEAYGNFSAAGAPATLMDALTQLVDASVTWDDLAWIKEASGGLPLVLKGVLTAEDALLACDHGVDAIVVSNHGGRQLDRAVATLDALEEVSEAVSGRCEIYLDGGVRRGVDVVTALALGARAVFVGRPYVYALAAAGEEGVAHCLRLLRAEVENALALLGAPRVGDVVRGHVTP